MLSFNLSIRLYLEGYMVIKKLTGLLCLIASICLTTQAKEMTFGVPVDETAQVNISTLLAKPAEFLDQNITVSGMIVGVCSKRGCWMELASDAKFEKLRIKVKDGDMVFPLTAKGKVALATGKLKAIQLDLKQTQQHKAQLAKRNGKTFDPATVTKPMAIYQLAPVGVKILD